MYRLICLLFLHHSTRIYNMLNFASWYMAAMPLVATTRTDQCGLLGGLNPGNVIRTSPTWRGLMTLIWCLMSPPYLSRFDVALLQHNLWARVIILHLCSLEVERGQLEASMTDVKKMKLLTFCSFNSQKSIIPSINPSIQSFIHPRALPNKADSTWPHFLQKKKKGDKGGIVLGWLRLTNLISMD